MAGTIISAVIALACFVLGAYLCTGRGWQLVAGLNTATPEERARYDVPRVCRATGVLMLGCGALCSLLALFMYLSDRGVVEGGGALAVVLSLVFMVAVVGGCGALLWYVSARCVRK